MTGIINDRQEMAAELRTVADRLEDGEYSVDNIVISRPRPNDGKPGRFALWLVDADEYERWSKVFHEQTENEP